MFLNLFRIVAVNRRLTSHRPSNVGHVGAFFGRGCCPGLYLLPWTVLAALDCTLNPTCVGMPGRGMQRWKWACRAGECKGKREDLNGGNLGGNCWVNWGRNSGWKCDF